MSSDPTSPAAANLVAIGDRSTPAAKFWDAAYPKSAAFAVLSLLAIFSLFPHLYTKFTTRDDTEVALESATPPSEWVEREDYQSYVNLHSREHLPQIAQNLAVADGRFQESFSYLAAHVPYYYTSPTWYHFVSLGSILLNVATFYFLVRVAWKSELAALLATALALTFLQYNWYHNLLTSYPFLFHLGLTCLFGTGVALLQWESRRQVGFAMLAGVAYLISLITYESFAPYAFVFLLVCAGRLWRTPKHGLKKAIVTAAITFLPIGVALALYLVCYSVFRAFHASSNDEAQLAPYSLSRIVAVVWQYASSTLPGYFYFRDPSAIAATFDGFAFHATGLRQLIERCRVEWLAKAFIAATFCGFILRQRRTVFTGRSFLCSLVVGVCCVIAPVALLGLTPTYQDSVLNGYSLAHCPSYFSYFALMFLITCMLFFLNQIVAGWRLLSVCYTLIVCCVVALGSLTTDYYNYYVTLDQQLSHLKWRVVDRLAQTDEFKALPDESVIYAPSLWRTRGIVANDENYWSAYLSQKLGKRILVADTAPRMRAITSSRAGRDAYFLQFQQEPKEPNQFVVFGKFETKPEDISDVMSAREFSLFTYSKNREFVLIGAFSRSDPAPNVNVDGRPADQIEGRVFFDRVDRRGSRKDFPRTIVKSTTPIDIAHLIVSYFPFQPAQRPVEIVYRRGFHGTEKDMTKGLTWNWSLAESELLVVTSFDHPVDRSIQFYLTVLTPRTVTIEAQGLKQSVVFDTPATKLVNLAYVLQPGANTFRFTSDQPAQLPGNGDSRLIAFGVENLWITEP
jgi:hypothetical protein